MCGIIGILGKSPVNQALYDGLLVLQHRGQDAAGILTCDDNRIHLRKDNGHVRDVFQERHMLGLKGNMGIGHVRYPTAGCDSPAEAQPFYVNSPYGLALAHNGNLTNADQLKDELYREDLRHINTDSDSEILLNVFAHELQPVAKLRLAPDHLFRAVSAVHRRCRGAYAVTMLVAGYGILAFEFVYMARPDSMIDGIYVHKTRLRMGERLANKIKRVWPDIDIDVVIPIPDTSRTAALQMAYELDLPYREGFIKNRYIGRTFIMPGQAERKKSVRQKLNAIDVEFRRKNVLLVDDSIVRGTTSKQIIQMARDAGARKVYFASAAPPVRFPNVYGIDMPSRDELIGNGRTEDEIAAVIGADKLIYQDLDDLIEAAREGNPKIQRFDCSCFNGEYITGDVTRDYLDRIEHQRNDSAKTSRSTGGQGGGNDLVTAEVLSFPR
ncbi:MAG: amidophosphoribosyltransferase [Gammaproteobacteria bacterium]|nr:amidophosphoribosyltransferase [Gammaproteobacteria bacterium]